MLAARAFVLSLLVQQIATAQPAPDALEVSLPWQLHSLTTASVVEASSGVAVFRDPQGNVDIAETTTLAASYRLTDRWAPTLRLAVTANDAPGAALDGASFGSPIAGVRYTRELHPWRFAVRAALAIPIGTGGGNTPDPRAARTNAAAITARPADEAVFAVNYATAIVGADVAYVTHGFTAQAEMTLLQSVRVRGDTTVVGSDARRTRGTAGVHLGMFLGTRVSLGADLEYRRWLSHPEMLDTPGDPRIPSALEQPATVTASIGARVHVRVGSTAVRPGLSITRGFAGPTPAMAITTQTSAVAISIPVEF